MSERACACLCTVVRFPYMFLCVSCVCFVCVFSCVCFRMSVSCMLSCVCVYVCVCVCVDNVCVIGFVCIVCAEDIFSFMLLFLKKKLRNYQANVQSAPKETPEDYQRRRDVSFCFVFFFVFFVMYFFCFVCVFCFFFLLFFMNFEH